MTSEQPLVSIIIPTYNRALLIGETLDSVLAQTYTHWECIIVDDGSTDNTAAMVQNYIDKDPRFQYHHRPADRPKGANACRNYGFEVSKGEFVNWFDDDDLMTDDFLEFKTGCISSQINIVITSGKQIDINGKILSDFKFNDADFLFKTYVLYKSLILISTVLFRKSFLTGKKLFDEKIYRLQENEFFSRLFFDTNENEYIQINHKSLLYRKHLNTVTQRDKKYVKVFNESLAYNYLLNLKRAIKLKDQEIIDYFYFLILDLYFKSFQFKHRKNTTYISNQLNKILLKHIGNLDKLIILNFLTLINRPSYRLRKYLYSKKIQIS